MIERLVALERAKRSGLDIATNTVMLTAPARIIKIRAVMDPQDKLANRSYGVRAFGSVNGGATWTFLGGGKHNTLGPKISEKTGLIEESPVCLNIDSLTRFPVGMLVRARIDVSDDMPVAVEIETE